MLETKFLYLYLMLFSLSYPLAQSFEWRIKYYKKWKRLFPAIGLILFIFVPWDALFALKGVWWFNEKYTMGINILGLPIEEWSFFIVVPFACVFIYEVLNYYLKNDLLGRSAKWITLVIAVVLLFFGFWFFANAYTSITFLLTGFVCVLVALKNPHWLGRFLVAFLVCLLPFLLINGALTGSFTQEAVVNYNPEEFIGIRIFTIPIEDSVYGFLMILLTIWVYER